MAEEFPFPYVVPVDPNIGRRVDLFFILRTLLGRGGMGAAYLAEHEASAHVRCVIKLMLAELARHPMAISRYKTETEAVAKLKHDAIVKLHNFGVLDDGQLFMRFEHIEGKTLDRYVAEQGGRLPLRKAAYFAFQLCDALQYAHDEGVIHRDLKPDNVMIEIAPPGSHLDERVKILDFGIAKVVATTSQHTGSGISMGTPRYMAPEQVTNAAGADGRADVFSLAVIFYLVVTGKLPWGTLESDSAIYHKQCTELPARPADDAMPAEVWSVVLRALSIDPAHRPTMYEFAMELACAIPAADGQESGIEILKQVKRSWVMSREHNAQTLPRPAAADPMLAAAGPSQLASGADKGSSVVEASMSGITANVRRRPRDAAAAPSLGANPDAPGGAPMGASAGSAPKPEQRPWYPPAPMLAALPTGLVSQKFNVQEAPIEARGSSSVVASEIDMAAGTPGPQPYAHAELPAVVLSTTQLPGLAPAPAASPQDYVEAAPYLLLPHAERLAQAARPSGRRLLLAGVCVFAIAAAFVVVRLARSRQQSVTAATSEPTSERAVARSPGADAVPLDAEAMAPVPPIATPAAAPRLVDAGQVAQNDRVGTSQASAPDPEASPAKPAPVSIATVDRRAVQPPSSSAPPAAKPASTATALASQKGELAVEVNTWAIIWLNGKQDEAPYRAKLPAGRYRLRMQHEDNDETISVVVRPNETTTVKRNW